MQRVGIGYDVHPFGEEHKLILGGVEIDHPQGMIGHSDADVLTHAICDALLGAVALGDIGKHFPANDPQYLDISSLKLLKRVIALLADRGFHVVNIDSTVICQQPRLASYIDTIRSKLAQVCGISVDSVSVKATTTEGLGFTGRGEGIAVQAIALVSD
jgi:2-C-methyl-D-erythritol 2,4-cyclodiphosphate synthase